ncbi:hypothetical protein ZHAS_00011315 [Anopheles sinensis]|uniref:Uncharacterized protein n=1 Tax=Anopheles sinensis TaxID=74873 RepID=A0A084VZW0_ANOSI|nr:hypothetical protein ZHAS_00011315 [Anopheles sinensis]
MPSVHQRNVRKPYHGTLSDPSSISIGERKICKSIGKRTVVRAQDVPRHSGIESAGTLEKMDVGLCWEHQDGVSTGHCPHAPPLLAEEVKASVPCPHYYIRSLAFSSPGGYNEVL